MGSLKNRQKDPLDRIENLKIYVINMVLYIVGKQFNKYYEYKQWLLWQTWSCILISKIKTISKWTEQLNVNKLPRKRNKIQQFCKKFSGLLGSLKQDRKPGKTRKIQSWAM